MTEKRGPAKASVSAWECSVDGRRAWTPDLNLLTDVAQCLNVPPIAFLAELHIDRSLA